MTRSTTARLGRSGKECSVPSIASGREDQAGTGPSIAERVAKLSSGQLACLQLVDQHLSSKEIAQELGISSHTVDQRVRGALHVLGVERRDQLACYSVEDYGSYRRLI